MTKKVKALKKICRVRRRLIAEGKSYQRYAAVIYALQFVEKYVNAYENASETYWEGFIQRNKEKIDIIIPKNKSENKYKSELGLI